MWDKLLPGIALAALSALTFVAYKHPIGYQRLAMPLRIVVPALFIAVVVWDVSSMQTFGSVYEFIDFSKIKEARTAAESMRFLNGYIFTAYILGMIYLEFLGFLPLILGDEKPPKQKH
jgi:hypothetical protein